MPSQNSQAQSQAMTPQEAHAAHITETVANMASDPDTHLGAVWFCRDLLYSHDTTALSYDDVAALPVGDKPVRLADSPLWYGHRANGVAVHGLPADDTQRAWLLHETRTHSDIVKYMQHVATTGQHPEKP